ncbi:MAG TPA: hypothetical protein DCM38_07630 [Gammaproteobacteria bacterium]|nr:hypothetical protein [Gammaproteobacteria bacterium]
MTMRVLHLIDSLTPGGAQTIALEPFDVQLNNTDIFLYALRQNPPHFEFRHPNIVIDSTYNKHSVKPLIKIVAFIKAHEIDILHCHLVRSQFRAWFIKKFWCPNLKLVFHEHGPIFGQDSTWWFHWRMITLLKLARAEVDRYIAVSNMAKALLIKKCGIDANKIEIVHNFTNLNKFHPNITVSKKLFNQFEGQGFKIGFVGRLDEVKGCQFLIKALSQLPFEAHLIFVGDGETRKQLNDLTIELGLQDKVSFLGFINSPEHVYRLFDVLVLPSIAEAFGNVIIEAQACGVPVIASNVSGPAEIITHGENGLLFTPENPSELAQSIEMIYRTPQLKASIVKKGLENINQFSLEEYINKINLIYEQLK